MKTQATYDDANLILRLYELRREAKLRQARDWFVKSFKASTLDEFNTICPPGSEENAYFRMVVGYWDMAASFITGGVLNEELFFQSSGELLLVWEKIKDVLPHAREFNKNPMALKSLELVANSFMNWLDRQAPEAYAAFAARVRSL